MASIGAIVFIVRFFIIRRGFFLLIFIDQVENSFYPLRYIKYEIYLCSSGGFVARSGKVRIVYLISRSVDKLISLVLSRLKWLLRNHQWEQRSVEMFELQVRFIFAYSGLYG